MSLTIPGFNEDRYFDETAHLAPAAATDAYVATECVLGCGRDRIAPDYPMCAVHATTSHYPSRIDCRCDGCESKRAADPCCESFVWNEPCDCAAIACSAVASNA